MSLFIDGRITTAEDLRAVESSILDVASTEGIELDKKIQVATREIGMRITEFLLNFGDDPVRARDLSSVVVTDALREWHVVHTLAVIFRDAHSSQLNDRYASKLRQYEGEAREAARLVFDIGIGLSKDPVPAADPPVCGTANGGVLPSADYSVQICWISASGNAGGLSDPVVFHVNAGQLLTVKPGPPPSGATGWKLFVARNGDTPMQQNGSPMLPGTTWVMPVDGLVRGRAPEADDDLPDLYITRSRIFRG